VAKRCARFPGESWRERDLTEPNHLAILIPDASFKAANACLQTHCGFGFADACGGERKFRGTQAYPVAPISTGLIPSHLAEHVSGLPRFS
jgi:acyl-CoA dehydrogenase